jgi:hypothetical protein
MKIVGIGRKQIVSTTSFINSLEGPLGPGFDRPFFEKSRAYFLFTSAQWKSSKVDAAIAIVELLIRFGVMESVQRDMISLSVVVSCGHFAFSLFSTNSCCLRSKASATKPWAPPGLQRRNNRQTTSKIFVPISIMTSALAQIREHF